MTQSEAALSVDIPQGRFQFGWIAGTLLAPRRQLREIVADSNRNWLTPLLILSLTVVIEALVIGTLPASEGAIDPSLSSPAAPYQYYTPEQQAQLDQALSATNTPFFRSYLPAGLAVASVWLRWLLLASILHLALTLIGSRFSMVSALNLLAWASLPLLLRGLVHIGFILSTDRHLISPGISGLVPAGATGALLFLSYAARGFDIYFLWQIALIGLGASTLTENHHGRVWLTVSLVSLAFLLVLAIPGFLLLQLSDLTVVRPFLF